MANVVFHFLKWQHYTIKKGICLDMPFLVEAKFYKTKPSSPALLLNSR
jgi:hypothetical protein